MRRLVVAAIALALVGLSGLAAGTAPQTKAPHRLFEDTGPITGAEIEKDGALVFRLWEQRILYRIAGQRKPKMERLSAILREARDRSRSVTVGFDAAEGRIDPATATIRYPVCSLAVGAQREEPVPHCAPDGPVTATGEKALALAYGFQAVRDFAAAAPLLEGAGDLPTAAHRRLVLWLRARNAEAATDQEPPMSEAADRFRINALGEYRGLANLEPDDPEHQFSIGMLLQDLGAYAEAGAVFDGILDRWSIEKFRVLIRKGALSRSQGDYVGALATLDRLAELGAQDGMRYHYHRGWTLSLLGRHQEAVAEYSEGLKWQSDFPSAYERRGCAYASLGRLDDALRDLHRAKALVQAQPGASAAPAVAREIKRVEEERQRVATAAAGAAGPIMRICDGDAWDKWERPRKRSPLLPRG